MSSLLSRNSTALLPVFSLFFTRSVKVPAFPQAARAPDGVRNPCRVRGTTRPPVPPLRSEGREQQGGCGSQHRRGSSRTACHGPDSSPVTKEGPFRNTRGLSQLPGPTGGQLCPVPVTARGDGSSRVTGGNTFTSFGF